LGAEELNGVEFSELATAEYDREKELGGAKKTFMCDLKWQ
jgi:hypothetical protein